MPTYGETLVANLINRLPEKRYFGIAEYTIPTRDAFANPDFVIVCASLGVIVLEVKDYVEILEGSTQKEIRVRTRKGDVRTEKNPVDIAKNYAYNLMDEFRKLTDLLHWHQGKQKLAFPLAAAVALPNIPQERVEQIERAGLWRPGQVIGKELLTAEHFETALKRLPWAWMLQSALDQRILDGIRGVLDPKLIITDPLTGAPRGIISIPQEREAYRLSELLSDEANGVIEQTSVRLVRGVAGSGKSLVLARRAEYLAEQHPDKRILIVAFNKDLIADFRQRISPGTHIEIINFHKICASIFGTQWRSPFNTEGWIAQQYESLLHEHGMTAEFAAEEIAWRQETDLFEPDEYLNAAREGRQRPLNQAKRRIINQIFDAYMREINRKGLIDWATVPKRALAMLEAGHPYRHAYDITLIDEAQDFAPSWIRVIKEITKPSGMIFMCDDPTQALFPSYSWKRKGIEVTGRTRVLHVPFRNTEQITTAAYSLIEANQQIQKADDITRPSLTSIPLRQGEKPLLLACKNAHSESQLIDQIVTTASDLGIGSIAILCHTPRHVRLYKGYTSSHGVYVEPFRKMKGLEFQLVILPGLHSAFESYQEPEAMIEKRRHIYTAMTRAREYLFMTYQQTLPDALKPLLPHVRRQLPESLFHEARGQR